MSNVSIKLLREGAKLPTRGSAFAAGYDLYACLDGDKELIIPPHATAMLPTGLSFALPEGTFGAVVARSGLASKQGLRPANCLGVIDSDYRGECFVALHNDSNEERTVRHGDRVAQLVLLPFLPMEFEEVDTLPETVRGEGALAAQGADSEHERPVHREHLARDERRLVRREIRDRRGDVLGLAEAAERRLLGKVLERFLAQYLDHIGLDDAGGNAVDADAARRQLHRERARQADERVLRAGIRHLARRAVLAPDRRNVHDGSALFVQHVRQHRLNGVARTV